MMLGMEDPKPSFNAIFRIVFFVWMSSLAISAAVGVLTGVFYLVWIYNGWPIFVVVCLVGAMWFFFSLLR